MKTLNIKVIHFTNEHQNVANNEQEERFATS